MCVFVRERKLGRKRDRMSEKINNKGKIERERERERK